MIQEMEQVFLADIYDFMLEEDIKFPTAALKASITLLTIGPIIVLYPFLQKYFMKGIFIGSLKG